MEKFPLSWNTSCIFLPKSSGILFLKKKKKSHTHTQSCFFQRLRHIIMKKKRTRPSWDIDTLQLTLTNVSCYQTSCLNTRRTIQCMPHLNYYYVTIYYYIIIFYNYYYIILGFPDSSVGKEPSCNAGNPGSISGSGRSAGEGIGYLLQIIECLSLLICCCC